MTTSIDQDLWLPADQLLALLKQEATRTGDRRLCVTRNTLNSWVYRRHVEFSPARGYRVTGGPRSVIAYLVGRGTRGLKTTTA